MPPHEGVTADGNGLTLPNPGCLVVDHLRRDERRMGQPLDNEIVRTTADSAEDA